MQRIYLDTNIITHLKDGINAELPDLLNEYGKLFIFPYSPAHFDDLIPGGKDVKAEEYLEEDIKMMDAICGDNLVDFDQERDMLMPYKCLPSEYVKQRRTYHSVFNDICNAFATDDASSDASFKNFRRLFDVTEGESPLIDWSLEMLKGIIGAFAKVSSEFLSPQNYKNQFERLSNSERQFYGDFHGIEPENAFDTLEDHLRAINPDSDFNTFMNQAPNMNNQMWRFVGNYLALNYCNYHKDKQPLANITADAKHCYYATCCDVFVTNDKKLKYKAEAIYHHLGICTKVITRNDLVGYIHNELEKEFAMPSFFRTLTSNLHYQEHYDVGDVHLKNIQFSSPAFSFFHSGILAYYVSEGYANYIFRFIRINDSPAFVYYAERERFFDFLNSGLNEKDQEFLHSQFIGPLLAGEGPNPFLLWANNRHRILLAEDDEMKSWPCICVIPNRLSNK